MKLPSREGKAAYRRLADRPGGGAGRQGPEGPFVAIRSSDREEAAELAAGAGEFETFLFVSGEERLLVAQQRVAEALRETDRRKDEFLAMLAHELRNPLAPIRNAVEVMAKLPAGDPAYEAMCATIERQSAQLARILDDLVDIARLTRGTLSIERGPLDIADAVQRAAETDAPLIHAASHRVEIDLPTEPLMVEGDLHRLNQLPANELSYAAS